MKLVFHGGKCCGIKTIYGFDAQSHNILNSPRNKKAKKTNDTFGYHVSSKIEFFTDAAPKEETYLERLNRLITFCKYNRPAGMIEVALSSQVCHDYTEYSHQSPTQIEHWGPILEEMGFKKVSTFKNSNTRRTISVYHLIYGGE